MSKKAADHQVESFADGVKTETQTDKYAGDRILPPLLDGDRVNMYLTLVGLLEADIDIETALALYKTEANAQKQKHNADRVEEFFTAVRASRSSVRYSGDVKTDVIGEVAERCFGRDFISPEELVLLRGLAYTDNIAAILRAASDIIRCKAVPHTPARPVAISGRRFTA